MRTPQNRASRSVRPARWLAAGSVMMAGLGMAQIADARADAADAAIPAAATSATADIDTSYSDSSALIFTGKADGGVSAAARQQKPGRLAPTDSNLLFYRPYGTKQKTVFDGDFIILAAGAGFTPEYDGARHRELIPGVGAIGRVGPFNFSTRGVGLAVDLIPDHAKAGNQKKVTFALGPVVKYDANRSGKIKDEPQVAALGHVRPWFEAGVTTAIAVHKLITPYDSLSFGTDVRWDVSGRMKGQIYSPSVSYFTPISMGTVVSASAFTDIIDDAYARYNYSINAAGAAASGLPTYDAHGGMKDYGFQFIIAHDLNNNLTDGGFGVLAGFNYQRLTGSAANTPITRLAGTANQWTFGVGVGYSF